MASPQSGSVQHPGWPHEREIAATLKRAGVPVSAEAVLDAVWEAVRQMTADLRVADPWHDLTPAEVEALDQGGLGLAQPSQAAGRAFVRTAAAYAALLSSSYTVPQVAQLLGTNDRRVRQRLIKGSLYGTKVNGEWRLPAFQFYQAHLIPGVEAIFPQLARDLHPVEVYNWFTTPNSDLVVGDDDTPMSPREWLIAGYPVEHLTALAAEL